MPRIRTIKPEFWQDEKIGRLSPRARLLFLASLNQANDFGDLRWSPAYVRGFAFAFDDLTLAQVAEIMAELSNSTSPRRALVEPYENCGESYATIRNFQRHQRIDRPSKLRAIPGPDDEGSTLSVEIFGNSSSPRRALVEPSSMDLGSRIQDLGSLDPSDLVASTEATPPASEENSPPKKPDGPTAKARRALDLINAAELVARPHLSGAGRVIRWREPHKALTVWMKNGGTPEAALLIAEHAVARWATDEKMRDYIRQGTLYRPSHRVDYLDAAEAWDASGRPDLTPDVLGSGLPF